MTTTIDKDGEEVEVTLPNVMSVRNKAFL